MPGDVELNMFKPKYFPQWADQHADDEEDEEEDNDDGCATKGEEECFGDDRAEVLEAPPTTPMPEGDPLQKRDPWGGWTPPQPPGMFARTPKQ